MRFFKEIQKPVNEAILKDQRLGEGVNHPALQGWDLMSVQEKRDALVAAGLAHHASNTPMTSIKLDDFLHAAKLKAQNQEDELGMGAAGRRELQRQADELAEMKRVTLRNERLHDEEVAFQRAETIQQRKDEMKKIADKYEHDLKVINTEHSNNMQAIRTGNEHEIKKMNMEYQHEKDMWDKNNPQEKPESEEPEYTKPQQSGDKFDQDTGEPIKPGNSPQSNQWHTSQQLSAPTKPAKPGNKDDDVTDVEPKPNKPLTLGNNMKKESSTARPQLQKPLMAVSLDRWKEAVLKRYPEARFATQKMINGATFATDRTGQVGIYDPKNSYAKVGPEEQITQQGVGEASKPDAYQRDEINATSGFGKNSYAYQMDGGANDEDHEGDARREKQEKSGTWYIRLNGKLIRDKSGQPYTYHGKAAANKAALTMQAKLFNQGKEFMLTTNPNDKVSESGSTGMYYSEELAQKVFDQNPNLDATGKANAVLDAGWPIAVADLGKKSAQHKFAYDEDFPSDFVSMYYQLQQQSQQGVAESTLRESDSPVAGAITRRIMIQRHDLLSKYGPAKVLAAIDDVADFVGDTEEIGSSDVSAWIKQVEQSLAGMGESVAEGSQRVDSLVTDALKIMHGSAVSDAVAALKTVLGDREYNGRRGYYNFYVKQLVDMYGQQGVAEGFNGEYDDEATDNPTDVICVDVPLFIRLMEYAREDANSDMDLHDVAERLTKLSSTGETVTMDAYDEIVGKPAMPVTEASGNPGYDNMLAVMKAVDAGQDATLELGGEPITLEYPEARFLAGKYKSFLNVGRQDEFLKYMSNPISFDRLMKQLRELMAKQKNFKGSVPGERGIKEAVSVAVKATVKESVLPATKKNEYWCKIDSKAKLIPEGYKKNENGYLVRKYK